ncbi:response regulator [Actinocatenispora comari]|uniref:DNA-binding response regulator n=1 Tax=Actinocatenispora comari TaxID=2807577 RepID=A0A8J4A530_9ACTN|nr:response regulator transcription factor [Actinocatenispora comari]GIL25021.1 DNA-binding response regulator [Actinocatenispora comari]
MIRVLIVDDEALVRSGLRLILSAAEDLLVVAEAADGAAAVAAVRRHRPDVVLMDVRMPGTDGLAAAEQLRALPQPPYVIMLTTFDEDEYVHRALRAGAVGFLLKDTPPTELAGAVRTVAAGNAMLAPTVTRRLLDAFDDRYAGQAAAASARLDVLTDREREVADEVAEGRSNAEIARRLGTTEATVKTHVSRILAKLGLDNRVQAAILVRDATHR